MPDEFEQRTMIVKHKRDEGKLKRWVVNPVKKLASWETKDTKRARVEA